MTHIKLTESVDARDARLAKLAREAIEYKDNLQRAQANVVKAKQEIIDCAKQGNRDGMLMAINSLETWVNSRYFWQIRIDKATEHLA